MATHSHPMTGGAGYSDSYHPRPNDEIRSEAAFSPRSLRPQDCEEVLAMIQSDAADLRMIRATLILNCQRGVLPFEYDESKPVLHNLVPILEQVAVPVENDGQKFLDAFGDQMKDMNGGSPEVSP